MEFSRQEYWTGLPFPPPGHLPDPGIELASLAPPPLAGRFFSTARSLGSPHLYLDVYKLISWSMIGHDPQFENISREEKPWITSQCANFIGFLNFKDALLW